MADEIQPATVPVPDPTVLTTQMLRHELSGVERELALRQTTREHEQDALKSLLGTEIHNLSTLTDEKLTGIQRVIEIHEAHRLELKADAEAHRQELKADGEKALSTATIAAEKAVQAALAAAEKARDQQTIASQLATTKAEQAASEQMKQQGETFGAAIRGLESGLNEAKALLGELRAEQRGGHEVVVDRRAGNSQWIAVASLAAAFGGVIVALLTKLLG